MCRELALVKEPTEECWIRKAVPGQGWLMIAKELTRATEHHIVSVPPTPSLEAAATYCLLAAAGSAWLAAPELCCGLHQPASLAWWQCNGKANSAFCCQRGEPPCIPLVGSLLTFACCQLPGAAGRACSRALLLLIACLADSATACPASQD